MKPLWVIQKVAVNDIDSQGMLVVFKSLSLPYELMSIAPFDYLDIPDISYDGPIIPYGGTRFIDKIRQTKKWLCWFNDNFQYRKYLDHYKQYMFNSDATCMKMRDFSPSLYSNDEYLFIRPNLDLKEFAGHTINPIDFMNWYESIKGKEWEVGENTDIVVAKASRIDNEWRVFVVNSKPVSASLYRCNHHLKQDGNVPQNVFEFVDKMIGIWKPSEVFVMDVCSLNGDLYVLEVGDFHSCGWYMSDKQKIISEVSKFAESTWTKGVK